MLCIRLSDQISDKCPFYSTVCDYHEKSFLSITNIQRKPWQLYKFKLSLTQKVDV